MDCKSILKSLTLFLKSWALQITFLKDSNCQQPSSNSKSSKFVFLLLSHFFTSTSKTSLSSTIYFPRWDFDKVCLLELNPCPGRWVGFSALVGENLSLLKKYETPSSALLVPTNSINREDQSDTTKRAKILKSLNLFAKLKKCSGEFRKILNFGFRKRNNFFGWMEMLIKCTFIIWWQNIVLCSSAHCLFDSAGFNLGNQGDTGAQST